jgi:hypothetical protein
LPTVSNKEIPIILGYTDFIKKMEWRELIKLPKKITLTTTK